MQKYKEDFIKFLVKSNALKFGDFTLKSGRQCPYFLNMGSFYNGSQIGRLGMYYAEALHANCPEFDVIFGPAYKGIPLAVSAAAAMFKVFNRDVGYCYNRKEAKDHGEGGLIIGAPITKDTKLVIVDDVMTAGTALRESMELMKKLGAPKVQGVLIAVDRMERGRSEKSAAQEVKDQYGVTVYSICTIVEIMEYLYQREIDGVIYLDQARKLAIDNYRKEYGVDLE
jgi:orotate phosphoribosyltransferase